MSAKQPVPGSGPVDQAAFGSVRGAEIDMAQAEMRRALVVEDDSCVSELGALMLEQFGLDVKQVRTAEEAIDHLRLCGGEVNVLIADINLPGAMDGVSLARSVAVLWPLISVIVTSGDPGRRLTEMPAGAVFIPKPWRALDIVAHAERVARDDHSIHALRL